MDPGLGVIGLWAPVAEAQSAVVDVAVNDGRFTTLAEALEAADLVDRLSGPGRSPSLPRRMSLCQDSRRHGGGATGRCADANEYLALPRGGRCHAVADVVTVDSADTVLGQSVAMGTAGGEVMVNDAVVIADIHTTNGVMHVIDTVLEPAS